MKLSLTKVMRREKFGAVKHRLRGVLAELWLSRFGKMPCNERDLQLPVDRILGSIWWYGTLRRYYLGLETYRSGSHATVVS